MADTKISKQEMDRFSRVIVMLLNRATMYQTNHPYVQQSIDEFFTILKQILPKVSPIVFIMSRDQLFVDEEALDPRIIVTKIVQHFTKTGTQSISFETGLQKNDIRVFLNIFTSLEKYPDSGTMKKALADKGVNNIKINHVVYIKATEDDEVVSRETLEEMTLEISAESQEKVRKQFMDMIMESVLAEEFEKTLTIDNLLKNPQELSQKMIETDQESVKKSDAEDRRHGPVLLHQLDMLNKEILDNSTDDDEANATDLVTAVFEMKNELLDGINSEDEDQLDASDKAQIIEKIDEVTDNAVLKLVRKQEQDGTSKSDLGQLLGRWIPQDEIDGVLDRVKTDMAVKPFAVNQIIENPVDLSKQIIEADAAAFGQSGADQRNPGSVIMRQLNLVKQEVVGKALEGEGASLSDVAAAVIELKEQLLAGMKEKKTHGTVYTHEDKIIDTVNDITDEVILKLVKEEYQAGELSPQRLAQILRRLIPEPNELKRLLPKIKNVLLDAGMPIKDYLEIIKTLGKELQSDELAKVIEESAEEIGIDGDSLIQEIKQNPGQAAELIFLAAEIRKGTGDEKIMTDLMVDYVERLGATLDFDVEKGDDLKGKEHLRRIIGNIESDIVGRLKNMNVKDDMIGRLEEKLESRMDDILDKAKEELLKSQGDKKGTDGPADMTVLKMMERSVIENEELSEILEALRSQAEEGIVDENNFEQIYARMQEEEQKRQLAKAQIETPYGVLKDETFNLIIKKEVSRAERYGVHLSGLGFSLIKATPTDKKPDVEVSRQHLVNAILKKMINIVRISDLVGEFGNNEIVVLSPFTPLEEAQKMLKRCLELLYLEPIEAMGASFTIKMAGVAVGYDSTQMKDGDAFATELSNQLMQMEIRIRNIQNLLR